MKKLLSLFAVLTMVFAIAACGVTVGADDDQDLVDAAIAALDFDAAWEARSDFTLPPRSNDIALTWESSNTDVIRIQTTPRMGLVTRPETGEGNQEVTLTVTATRRNATASTSFTVTVPEWAAHEAPLREALEDFSVFRLAFVIGDLQLPDSYGNVSVDWESSHPEYIAADGSVTRPTGPNNVNVMLTANFTYSFAGNEYTASRNFFANAITTQNTYTFRTSISPVTDINPQNTTLANASDLYALITTPLYMGDFDWEEAGLLVGDFRNASELPYDRFPRLAAELPVDVNEDGTTWQVELRDDFYFEDGTHIDAELMVWSWQQLINPLLVNDRASVIYSDLNIVNAREYFLGEIDDIEDVGIRVVSDYVFEFTVRESMTQWNVLDSMLSGITGPVHKELYLDLMNEAGDQTEYGRGDMTESIVSYGPFSLVAWEDDQVYVFEKRADYIFADEYRYDGMRFEVLTDQSQVVDEFRAGNLDVAGVGGAFYEEFENWPNLRLSPDTATFRWAFNVGERPDGNTNPMLQYVEFRQAIYHAIDRAEMTQTVTAPSLPNQTPISQEYVIHYTSATSYRGTPQGESVIADKFPETHGYAPAAAAELFDIAYDKAVADGVINDGDTVWLELSMMDAETNWTTNEWVQEQLEEVLGDRFEFVINAVTSDGLDEIGETGNFDMMFYAWLGLKFDPISMIGQVYNSTYAFMHERGFDTANWPVSVELPGYHAELPDLIAEYQGWLDENEDDHQAAIDEFYAEFGDQVDDLEAAIAAVEAAIEDYLEDEESSTPAEPSEELEDLLDELADLEEQLEELYGEVPALKAELEYHQNRLARYEDDLDELDTEGTLTLVYHQWFIQTRAGGILYDTYNEEDWLNVMAAMERELLDNVIHVPLFTRVATSAYTERVVFENNFFHPWMGWGGQRYMYLNQPDQ